MSQTRRTAEPGEVQEEVLHSFKGINARGKKFKDAAAKLQCIDFMHKISKQRCMQQKGTRKMTCLAFL